MKQRLSIARVLVHDPKVLLAGREPAGNLDPRARIEMRELLKELRRMGKTILISSHILPELADPVQYDRASSSKANCCTAGRSPTRCAGPARG